MTIIRDITPQKQAEQKLRESEALYRGVVEHANDAIYVITPDGFEFVNPAFEELTDYSEDEVTAENFDFWNIIHPDDHEVIRQCGRNIPFDASVCPLLHPRLPVRPAARCCRRGVADVKEEAYVGVVA